ncbi:MAG TPA: hypothetical protein VF432_03870 [Thermoanaerobaculia bacterium]
MIKTDNPRIPSVAADGTTPLTPEQIVEHLRMLRGHVPDFGPLPTPSAMALRTTARIPAEFVLASINTVGAAKPIASAIQSDAPALLTEREDVDRWSAVEDELRTMLNGVAAANLARRHRIGLAALQTYSIARQLVRKKEHADLLPHVENMRRANRFGRKRTVPQDAKPVQPAPDPAPKDPAKPS